MPSFNPLSTLRTRRIRIGNGRVAHHGHPERRIGRGEDGAQQQRRRERHAREQDHGDEPARQHRQDQTDGEQPTDEARVATKTIDVDGRGVREQHERERDLSQGLDHLGVEADIEDAKDVRPQQHPDQDEHDRWTDREAVETARDQRIARQDQDEDRDPGFQCASGLLDGQFRTEAILRARRVRSLLPRHRDPQALLGADQVILVVDADVELDPLDRPGEPAVSGGVVR